MRIEKIHIKGFRNFEDEEIFFQPKTLIIGANDVGKTNLLYALRILFDKSISEHDLDLKDSDYKTQRNIWMLTMNVSGSSDEEREETAMAKALKNIKL